MFDLTLIYFCKHMLILLNIIAYYLEFDSSYMFQHVGKRTTKD